MNKRYAVISGVVLLVLVSIAATLLFLRNHKTKDIELPRGQSREYTFSEVQTYNVATNCWVSFGAQVFDITRLFASLDPDQATELAKLCGTNLDVLPPSIKTAEKLSQYQIGILAP